MFVNMSGEATCFGIMHALDTLGAAAVGNGNYRQLGELTQRGMVVMSLFLVPVLAIWLNAEALCIALSQVTNTIHAAVVAGRALSPGEWVNETARAQSNGRCFP